MALLLARARGAAEQLLGGRLDAGVTGLVAGSDGRRHGRAGDAAAAGDRRSEDADAAHDDRAQVLADEVLAVRAGRP